MTKRETSVAPDHRHPALGLAKALLPLLLTPALLGCGQKGPLTLPKPPASASQPAR